MTMTPHNIVVYLQWWGGGGPWLSCIVSLLDGWTKKIDTLERGQGDYFSGHAQFVQTSGIISWDRLGGGGGGECDRDGNG